MSFPETKDPTASVQAAEKIELLFLETLRYALAGATVPWTEPLDLSAQRDLFRMAAAQTMQPLVAEALFDCPALAGSPMRVVMKREARSYVTSQAARTAEILLLLRQLEGRGLRPVVLKGPVCRSLYPEPEQRPSNDEDLLIAPEEAPRYHEALLACGLRLKDPGQNLEDADEITYVDPERNMYLELHLRLFEADSQTVGDCNAFFDGALPRTTELEVYGQKIRTLAPTDHLLFMLCHAYKHLLYGGFGVRQICDMCLFADRYAESIDFDLIRHDCDALGIQTLVSAIFRIGEQYLGIPGPAAFADLSPELLPLIRDCMTGGLYGVNDLDRAHSSTLTLEAVAADKQGSRSKGVFRALFPPAKIMSSRFPYLRKRPYLLPVAWGQRLWNYARSEKESPGKSMQIGKERVALLERYGLLGSRRP